MIISQIIIPIACLLINLIYLKYAPIKAEDSPLLKIDIQKYTTNYVPVKLGSNHSNQSQIINDFSRIYELEINSFPNTQAFNLNKTDTISLCSNSRNNIDDFISCMGRLSLNYIVDNYLVATDLNMNANNQLEIIGFFSNQPYHVAPLALNLITNSLFKLYTNSSDRKITVINHPLPRNLKEKLSDLQLKNMAGFNVASGLTFGFSFLIASFAVFIIKERSSDAKHLQYLSGCNSYVFWISALIWDMLNYILSIMLVPILLKVKFSPLYFYKI